MQKILKLKQRLESNTHFNLKYDLSEDDKAHLLYICPKLNATGYYRMITQAMELNKTDTHKAIITSIDANDFGRSIDDFTAILDVRLIQWADYIIFPPIFIDITYLVKAIKALNRASQVSMDVDQDYFSLNEMSYGKEKITNSSLTNLEKNIAIMDLVTVSNVRFKNFLHRFILSRNPNSDVLVEYLPNLVSEIGYENMPVLKKNTSEKFRVGIIRPSLEDLLFLKDIVLKINSSLKKQIQFVCIGNSTAKEVVKKNGLEKDIEFYKTVSFQEYFKKLGSLKLDVVLLPAKETVYNKYHSSYSYLELSVFGIPVIASTFHASKLLLKEGETGFLADHLSEWFEVLELLIKSPTLKQQVGNNALKNVWRNYSFNNTQLERITAQYI